MRHKALCQQNPKLGSLFIAHILKINDIFHLFCLRVPCIYNSTNVEAFPRRHIFTSLATSFQMKTSEEYNYLPKKEVDLYANYSLHERRNYL